MKEMGILIILFLLSGCLKNPNSSVTPPEKMMVLNGVLQNIKNYQKIKLYRAFSIQEIDSLQKMDNEDTLAFYFGISGAKITLIAPDSIYLFNENCDKKGEYILKNFSPQSGADYQIQVKKEGFKSIVGQTKYPKITPFNIGYHFNDNRDLYLNWNRISGAKGYRVDLLTFTRQKFGPYDYYEWGLKRIYMTEKTNIKIDNSDFHYANKKIKIIIWAIDDNYYQFYNFENYYDPFEFHLIDYGNFTTVDNGLGYFGSAYGDSIIIEW